MSSQRLIVDSVAIEVTSNAFLPEAYVYRDMFIAKGFACDLVQKGSKIMNDYDAVVLFHGFHPFWKKYPQLIIGEYHSLSVGRFGWIKDILKRVFNVRASYYIFLNDFTRKRLFFSNKIPFSLRGMGYDSSNNDLGCQHKEFDVVYCGSFRSGVIERVMYLADLGLRIAVVGFENQLNHQNVYFFGKVSSQEAARIMLKSKWGLNYTPDGFPLNIQDSTKVIEYCALGLGVITNRYKWVDRFEKDRCARFLDLDQVFSADDVKNFEFTVPDVSELEWSRNAEVLFDELNAQLALVN
jgi:hypothetical protein